MKSGDGAPLTYITGSSPGLPAQVKFYFPVIATGPLNTHSYFEASEAANITLTSTDADSVGLLSNANDGSQHFEVTLNGYLR